MAQDVRKSANRETTSSATIVAMGTGARFAYPDGAASTATKVGIYSIVL